MYIEIIKITSPMQIQKKIMILGVNGQSLVIDHDKNELVIRTLSQVRAKIFKSCLDFFIKHMQENVGSYYTHSELTQLLTPWFFNLSGMRFSRIYSNNLIEEFKESFIGRVFQFDSNKQEVEIDEPEIVKPATESVMTNRPYQHTLKLKAGRTLTVTYDGDLDDSEIELLSTYLRYFNK